MRHLFWGGVHPAGRKELSRGADVYKRQSLFTRTPCDVKFALANGLALSLEFKMAAEILKTVLVRDLKELLVLGAVILLRALLSFLIHFEMKGTHPPK